MVNNRTKTDPAILSARRRQRDLLRSEWERSDKHATEVARNALWRASNEKGVDKHSAVAFATGKLCSAVMNSMDIRAGIRVRPNRWDTTAYTDFKNVYIDLKRDSYNLDDPKSIARFIHFTKGLLYHEIGHIKFSASPSSLLAEVGLDTSGIVQKYNVLWSEFRKAWNALEDQRMECAMVRYSNTMRVYFTTIVLDYVTASSKNGSWFLLAGRTYLPKEVLDVFRNTAKDVTALTDPSLVADTSAVVSRYKRATDAAELLAAVAEYVPILKRWELQGASIPDNPSHNGHGNAEHGEEINRRLRESATEEQPNTDDQPTPGGNAQGKDKGESEGEGEGSGEDTDDGADGEGKGSGKDTDTDDKESGNDSGGGNASGGGDSDDGDDGEPDDDDGGLTGGRNETENSDGPVGGNGSSHSETGPSNPEDQTPSPQDILRDALEQSVNDSPITENDVNSFLTDANGELGNPLPHNSDLSEFSDEDLVKVEEVFNGMMATLEPLAVQADPSWRFRQEQGILDPTAFSLREPGDSDYWCDLDDVGGTGFDLAVTVTLDVSGSMNNMARDVGIAALGIRKACDALGVPCTVSTFSDVGELLWAADEEPSNVFPYAKGGTNPIRVLEVLDDQRFGKSKHLVIALTDGAWSGVENLAPYSSPGRVYYVVGIGSGMEHTISRLHADAWAVIGRPEEFPQQATAALTGFFV